MKLKYEAPKRSRIHYKFMGFTTFEHGWWFSYDTKSWTQHPPKGKGGYSSHQPCKTIKAFIRKLQKAPKGVEFILVSRWYGHNVIGFGNNDKLTRDERAIS